MATAAARPPTERLTWDEWKLVGLLAIINFTHILDFVIVMPLGDRLREELMITPRQFGIIVSAYGIAATLAGLLASTVIDRFDRRRTMLLSFAGFVLTTVYCGVAPDYGHLVAARSLAGLCGGVVASTVMAFIVDSIPERRRGRAIGAVTSSFAVASTIGLPVGLYLAQWYGHFGASFVSIAVLGGIVWAMAAWSLPSLPGRPKAEHLHPLVAFREVVRQPNHLWPFAFMLTMVFGTFMIVPYIAPYLEENCHLARENLPTVYAVAGAFTLLVMNLSGWLTDRFGPRRVFIASAGGAIVMTLVITNLPPVRLAVAVAVVTLFMSVASSRMVPAQTMMLRSADPKSRGAFTSLNTAVSHLATGVGPLISGMIIGEASPGGPLTHYGAAGLLAVAFGATAIAFCFLLRPPATAPA